MENCDANCSANEKSAILGPETLMRQRDEMQYAIKMLKGIIEDIENGECIKTLEGHKSYVNSAAFSPDGKYAYLICQLMNCVNVYKYSGENYVISDMQWSGTVC